MADEVAHGKTVLSAIVAGGGSVRALDHAAEKLAVPELFFTDAVQLKVFLLLERYRRQAGGIMPREVLSDLLRGRKPGTVQMFEETYDGLAAFVPEEHQFRHAVDQLRELAAERATGEALAMGKQILGANEKEPFKLEDGRALWGHEEARAYVQAALADAEQLGADADTPVTDVARDGDEVMAAYARAKALKQSGKRIGVAFGLDSLDKYLGGGIGNGLCLVVAGTTVGKSSLCVQAAWFNAVIEGRNVLVFTTEQHCHEVRLKLVARHSRLPKFGLAQGLDTARMRGGWLSEEEERVFAWVLDDLKTGGYGGIEVVQMPERCTVPQWTGRAESMGRRRRPDLMVFDYLQLCDPALRTRDSREHENQSGIVKSAHRWGQAAFHGHGVPLISPWQANQGGAQALRGGGGGFSLDQHMSQSSEAAKTAGTVITLAAPEEDTTRGRAAPLTLTVEKNRDYARGGRFQVVADYATSHFADREDMGEDPIDLGD
jgi:hypothetical protein